ncbi:MAG: hypothetical protein WCM76_12735 [Bacteroidota bacterium]
MKGKIVLCLLVLLISAQACKKITEEWTATKVNGTVINWYTRQPIPYADVKITTVKSPGNSGETLAEFKTDENGNFDYTFHADKDYTYLIGAKKQEACFSGGYPAGLSKGKKNHIEISGYQTTHLKIHIRNNSPYDVYDKICVQYFDYSAHCATGTSIDTVFICGDFLREGSSYQNVHIEVTKNNITTSRDTTIYLYPCDTNYISINY